MRSSEPWWRSQLKTSKTLWLRATRQRDRQFTSSLQTISFQGDSTGTKITTLTLRLCTASARYRRSAALTRAFPWRIPLSDLTHHQKTELRPTSGLLSHDVAFKCVKFNRS